MNGNPNSSFFSKLFVAILLLLFFISACKKQNVCALTPEQSPAIRGFKLGLSYDEVVKKFPEVCKPYFEKNGKLTVQISFGSDEKINCEANNFEMVGYSVTRQKHPDFEGISIIVLNFNGKILNDFTVNYESSTDSKFQSIFEEKTIESLDLAKWTNWIDNKSSPFNLSPDAPIENIYEKTLLCQKVLIKTSVREVIPTNPDAVIKNGISYYPSMTIKAVNEQSKIEAQKKEAHTEQEQQEREKYQEKEAEEARKAETFKP